HQAVIAMNPRHDTVPLPDVVDGGHRKAHVERHLVELDNLTVWATLVDPVNDLPLMLHARPCHRPSSSRRMHLFGVKDNATVPVKRTQGVEEKISPHLNDVVKVGGEGVSVSLPQRRQGYSPRPSSTSRPRPAPNAFR